MTIQELVHLMDPEARMKAGQKRVNVRCPGHDDKTPSLSVWIDDKGKAAFNCFAGCSHDQILAGLPPEAARLIEATWRKPEPILRIPPKRHRPSSPTSPNSSNAEAIYRYTDEQGNDQYEVHRYPGKKILQYHREDGRLVSGRGNGVLYPYRLPDLLAARDSGNLIYICEGEKDCDTLAQKGLTATTNPDGAGKWRSEFNRWLDGADVVILPDNDEPGRNHAQQVAAELTGHAKTIRVVELPGLPKSGDVTDWLETNTVSELEQLVSKTPTQKVEAGPFGKIYTRSDLADLKPPATVFGSYIVSGGVNMLYGQWGSLKSFLLLTWAAHLATGTPWNGHHIEQPETVLFWAPEGQGGLHGRLSAWETHHGLLIPDHRLRIPQKSPKLDKDESFVALARLVEETEASHLMIDTLIRVKGDLAENASDEVGGYLLTELAHRICDEYGCTVVTSHHVGHEAKDRPRGSSSISDNVDGLFQIKEAGNGIRSLHVRKLKDQPFDTAPDHLRLLQVDDSAVLVPADNLIVSDSQTKAVAALTRLGPNGEWVNQRRLAAAADLHLNTLRTSLHDLIGVTVDYREGKGTASEYRLLHEPNPSQPALRKPSDNEAEVYKSAVVHPPDELPDPF